MVASPIGDFHGFIPAQIKASVRGGHALVHEAKSLGIDIPLLTHRNGNLVTKFLDRALEELQRFREEGKVLATGVSIHARKLAGSLVARGAIQALMMRYNAAHRGAEQDIFPHLAAHNPAVISYPATRWTYLLRRPRGWPRNGRIPTPELCYRFVLSNPNVHVCLTAPKNMKELEQNLAALHQGPLSEDDMQFMRDFGDAVHAQKKWFM